MVFGSHANTRAMYSTPPCPSLAASTAAYRRRSFSDSHPKNRCIFCSTSAAYLSMPYSLLQNLLRRKDTPASAIREVILDHILSADTARQPPAATVGQRVYFQCDWLAEPHREIRVVLHRILGQRVDEDIEPGAVHHQVGHHLRELVGREKDQHVGDRVRPHRCVAEGLDLDLAMRPERRAHPFGNGACACRLVVDVGVIAQVMDGFCS